MKKVIFLLSFLLFVSSYAYSQFQWGQTLFEMNAATNTKDGISVSSDGSEFVLCNSDLNEVKVFEIDRNEWRQKGQTLSHLETLSAVISGDGNTVVINMGIGIVIYKWDGVQWIENDSPKFNNLYTLVRSLSISSSGNRLSVLYEDFSARSGGVVVYEWEGTRWHEIGDHIDFSWIVIPHWYAPKVVLSGDGSTLVMGYISDSIVSMAEVFKYSGTEWTKTGERILLNATWGDDVSISNDGKVVAISGGGQIKVVWWDGQRWEEKGTPILVDKYNRSNVELDSTGNRLAFAEIIYSDRDGNYLGRIAILEFNGEKWNNIAPHEQGEQAEDRFGTSMGLSASGKVIIAASDPLSDSRQSYIKAFKYDGVPFSPISFLSSTQDTCDYERIVSRPQYTIELSDGQVYNYILDGNSSFMLPIGDSILISPKAPPHYRAIPEVLIIDSNMLEEYKAKSGTPIRDTFCLIPNDPSTVDVRIDIIITHPAQPGIILPVLLKYSNMGTVIVSGNVEFNFDDQFQTITHTSPMHDMISANHIRWNYEDLLPLESRQIKLYFDLNTPMSNPPLNGGERLLYSAKIEPVAGDVNPYDNQTEAIANVVNSFDPNDKRCMQGRIIRPESVGHPLTYVIRFENLGTAEAIDVRIRDIIDTSKLDISSFELLDASHPNIVQISKGNIIDFIFKNIYLPFDDDNNDGFVAFNLNTKKDLQVGDAVFNDAAIYFDFNYPVITNEAITLVAQETTGTTNIHPQVELKAQPNPARDHTRVSASAGIHRMDLFDPSGRHIRQQVYTRSEENTRDFNTTGISQGIYWLRVTTERGTGSISLIKE